MLGTVSGPGRPPLRRVRPLPSRSRSRNAPATAWTSRLRGRGNDREPVRVTRTSPRRRGTTTGSAELEVLLRCIPLVRPEICRRRARPAVRCSSRTGTVLQACRTELRRARPSVLRSQAILRRVLRSAATLRTEPAGMRTAYRPLRTVPSAGPPRPPRTTNTAAATSISNSRSASARLRRRSKGCRRLKLRSCKRRATTHRRQTERRGRSPGRRRLRAPPLHLRHLGRPQRRSADPNLRARRPL